MKHIFLEFYIYIYKITHTPPPAQKSNGRPLNRSQTVPNVSVRRAEYNLSIIVGHGWGTPLPRFLRRIVMSLKGMQVVSPGGIIGPPLNNQKHSFTLDNTHHTLKRNETNSFTMLLSQIATKTNQLWQKSRTAK